jgi:hypothetical protein
MGLATAVAIAFIPKFVEFQRFRVVVILCELFSSNINVDYEPRFVLKGLGSSCIADIVITSTMVLYLVSQWRTLIVAFALFLTLQSEDTEQDSHKLTIRLIELSEVNLKFPYFHAYLTLSCSYYADR